MGALRGVAPPFDIECFRDYNSYNVGLVLHPFGCALYSGPFSLETRVDRPKKLSLLDTLASDTFAKEGER